MIIAVKKNLCTQTDILISEVISFILITGPHIFYQQIVRTFIKSQLIVHN